MAVFTPSLLGMHIICTQGQQLPCSEKRSPLSSQIPPGENKVKQVWRKALVSVLHGLNTTGQSCLG